MLNNLVKKLTKKLGLEVRSKTVKKVTNEKIGRDIWRVEKLRLIQKKLLNY